MALTGLASIAERCYKITQSYLEIEDPLTAIIAETQDAIKLTKKYLLQDIFDRWSPLGGEISLSYNGGKDCQVLLLIYLACLHEYYSQNMPGQPLPIKRLNAVFIDQAETFTTLEQFVEETKERYSLSLYESERGTNKNISMAQAFDKYLTDHPETKAIVIGIRHTDPFAQHLKPIQRTDDGWPDFLRLQPILHWKLAQVWSFLLYSGEPICGIYSVGFTSLGDISHTLPNSHLRISNSSSLRFQWEIEHSFSGDQTVHCSALCGDDVQLQNHQYLPGWYLVDDTLERCGRNKS
ncbi:related to FAD synthase [Zygosaccharomyces bailii ISA1307]|nr:related to FAD synthase [Zygosaccharomyces bailii ISA1307]